MIPPNKREAAAISRLAALTLMDPDPRTPDHDDSCIAAARVVAEWVRRAKIDTDPARPVPSRRTRRGQGRRPESPELRHSREVVRLRSGGFCEIVHVGCTGRIEHVHHRLRRSQGGGDSPDNLLGLCRRGHDFVHANPALSVERGWLLHAGAVR